VSIKQQALKTSKQLFKHLGVSLKDIAVDQDDDRLSIAISVSDEDSGLLIGYHGETLSALQNLLGQIINKRRGESADQNEGGSSPSDLPAETSVKEGASGEGGPALRSPTKRGEVGWHRVDVNINDYRSQRELQLKQMAQNASDRAISTGDEIEMPYLTAAERRIIHLELANRDNINTYSEGEAED
jgi:spoIIIJ-associated protein